MGLAQAKTLRKQMTDAERRLWYLLRGHRFGGTKFNGRRRLETTALTLSVSNRK
jgi:very-short-patch-repair endonuclease